MPRCALIEEQIGVAIAAEVPRHDQIPAATPASIRFQQRYSTGTICGVEFAGTGAAIVEQQVGVTVTPEIARDDHVPAAAPVGVGAQFVNRSAISRIELTGASFAIVEEEIGPPAAAEVAGNDDVPGITPAGLRLEQGDAAGVVSGVELALAGVPVVEQK